MVPAAYRKSACSRRWQKATTNTTNHKNGVWLTWGMLAVCRTIPAAFEFRLPICVIRGIRG
jgi:hypothetical protein